MSKDRFSCTFQLCQCTHFDAGDSTEQCEQCAHGRIWHAKAEKPPGSRKKVSPRRSKKTSGTSEDTVQDATVHVVPGRCSFGDCCCEQHVGLRTSDAICSRCSHGVVWHAKEGREIVKCSFEECACEIFTPSSDSDLCARCLHAQLWHRATGKPTSPPAKDLKPMAASKRKKRLPTETPAGCSSAVNSGVVSFAGTLSRQKRSLFCLGALLGLCGLAIALAFPGESPWMDIITICILPTGLLLSLANWFDQRDVPARNESEAAKEGRRRRRNEAAPLSKASSDDTGASSSLLHPRSRRAKRDRSRSSERARSAERKAGR